MKSLAIKKARAGIIVLSVVSTSFSTDLDASTQLADTADRPISDWQQLAGLPKAFQGRWSQMHLETGERLVSDPKRCKHDDGVEAADLLLGPNWFLNGSGSGYLMNIEFSPSEQAVRLRVAYNDEGRVRLGLELFSLSADKSRLEVASQPEIGWEVMNYSRC